MESPTPTSELEIGLIRYKLIFKHAKDVMLFVKRDGSIMEANLVAEKVYGYGLDELKNMNIFELRDNSTAPQIEMQIEKADCKGITFETIHKRKDGSIFPVEVSSQGFDVDGERVLISVIRDITQRKQTEDKINHLSYYNSLTGLPNRKLLSNFFEDIKRTSSKSGEMLAVMVLDLDNLKNINDTLGYHLGDEILNEFAKRLKNAVNEDDLIAHMGGDEFIIVKKNIKSRDEAREMAVSTISALRKSFNLDKYELFVSSSMGISMFPEDGLDFDELTKNADAAMYFAKENGRDRFEFYNSSMNQMVFEHLMIENRLYYAIQNNELEVYYQPKVNIEDGRIVGLEALLRWKHPNLGNVPPAQFIPVAEKTGLIEGIGEWVLRAACSQNKSWQDAGFKPVVVAVNLSLKQFERGSLTETIQKILEETGLDAKYLEVEITESIAMSSLQKTVRVLNELKDMGIKISLDDFGTGYSSLSHLQRLPIDTIKIDKSFVANIGSDENHEIIIEAIIAMAHKLKLKTIAEGVEVESQVSFLRDKNCNEIQGYLFGRPEPAHSIEEKLRLH